MFHHTLADVIETYECHLLAEWYELANFPWIHQDLGSPMDPPTSNSLLIEWTCPVPLTANLAFCAVMRRDSLMTSSV